MSLDLETLRRFPILSELSESELALLMRRATPCSLARGEFLFREDDAGDALYLLVEGIAVAERLVDPQAGTRKDLAVIPPLSFIGEMALADDAPRSASVRAEIPCRAYRLSRQAVDEVTAESPQVAAKLFRALFGETSRRLRATNEELVAIFEVGRFVAGAAEPKGVAESIVRSLRRRLEASNALVALYEVETNQLRIAYALGERSGELLGTPVDLSSGIAARAYDERKPILVERLLGATEGWESESMLLAPLLVRDQPVGLLLLGAPTTGIPFQLSDLSLTAAVANISAPVLRDAFGGVSRPLAG